jgi:hypothetical protein
MKCLQGASIAGALLLFALTACGDGGGDTTPDDARDAAPEQLLDGLDAADLAEARSDLEPECPGACCADADCDDHDACTTDRCDTNACVHDPLDCDDANPCTDDACVPGEGCRHASVPGCCAAGSAQILQELDFDEGLDELTLELFGASSPTPGTWHASSLKYHSPGLSLHFGVPEAGNYDNGKRVAARALTPPVALPGNRLAELTFWIWLDVEPGDATDLFGVSALTGGRRLPLFEKRADLRLEFAFDSVSGDENDFGGIYLDDVVVSSICTPPTCAGAADCSDGLPCTAESCDPEGGSCAFSYADGCCLSALDCRDGDACTLDLCDGDTCRWQASTDPECCNSDADCSDVDACTTDSCLDGLCQHHPSGAAGCCHVDADCDDGDACTHDTCVEGGCVLMNACCEADLDCDDGDPICTNDVCVEGTCVRQPTGITGCCVSTLAELAFDDGSAGGLVLQNSNPVVGWHVFGAAGASSAPTPALYYGDSSDPVHLDYDSGAASWGTATLALALEPAGSTITLRFEAFFDTEATTDFDTLTFTLVQEEARYLLWDKTLLATTQAWTPYEIDLSAFAGQSGDLEIRFDTIDDTSNQGEGVYVDNLTVTSSCTVRACEVDADCDDRLVATDERCLSIGQCDYAPKSTPCSYAFECDDGGPCTADACVAGFCQHAEVADCCEPDLVLRRVGEGGCDDDNPCTVDTCDDANTCHRVWTPGCCLADTDCDDADPCTTDSCPGAGLACTHDDQVGCCSLNLDCDDDDALTVDTCAASGCLHRPLACAVTPDCADDDPCTSDACHEGTCTWLPVATEACCQPVLFEVTFDDGTAGPFSLLSSAPGEPWRLSEARADSSPFALHHGGPESQDGGHGAATWARVVSDTIFLPANSSLTLSFALWTDVEAEPAEARLSVLLRTDLGSLLVWDEADDAGPASDWALQQVDLTAYAGQAVQLEFRFEADDAATLTGEGVYLDGVRVTTSCAPAPCQDDPDCPYFDACTPSRCVGGLCLSLPRASCCAADAECDDANACTVDTCPVVAGDCAHAWRAHCCLDATDCDDANPCTDDGCTGAGGICTHDQVDACCLTNGDCDDHLGATLDLCLAAACVHKPAGCTTATDCDDADACTTAECLTGACTYLPVPTPECCAPSLLAADFDQQGASPFALSPAGWRLSEARHGDSGPASLFLGPPATPAVGSPAPEVPWIATATCPPLALPGAAESRLAFSIFIDLEPEPEVSPLRVRVLADDGPLTVWDLQHLEPGDYRRWLYQEVDLSTFQGQSVRLEIRYEDPNGTTGLAEGIYLDDVRVETTCAPPPCTTDADCPTPEACLAAACVDGRCLTARVPECCVIPADCVDGDDCTLDACGGGTCTHEPVPGCCNVDGDCDDDTPCTLDACDDGHACTHVFDPECSTPLPYLQAFGGAPTLGLLGWTGRNQAGGPGTNWELTGAKGPFDDHLMFDDTPVVQTYTHRVRSPRLAAPEGVELTFAWSAFFDAYTAATTETTCTAEVSSDDGDTWTTVWSATYKKTGTAAERTSVDVSSLLAGAANARVSFTVSGQTSYDLLGWHVDDVRVLTGKPPVVDTIGDQTIVVGDLTEILFTANDPEGAPLSATLLGPTGDWAHVAERTGDLFAIVLEPSVSEIGEHAVTLVVSDGQFEVERTFVLSVTGAQILLAENFDPGSSLPLLGWATQIDAGSAAHWQLTPVGAINGSPAAEFDGYPAVSNFAETLLSPLFDASSATDGQVQLVFTHLLDLSGVFEGTLSAKASADGGESWSPVWTRDVKGGADLGPEPVVVPVAAELAASPTARVAFTLAGKSTQPLSRWQIDTVRVLRGSPPTVTPVAPQAAPIGQVRDIVLHASDADGDALTFQLLEALPFLALEPLGPNAARLRANPGPADWGTYGIGVVVSDGLFTTRLEFTVVVDYEGASLLFHEAFDDLSNLSDGGWTIAFGGPTNLVKHWGLVFQSPLGDTGAALFGPAPIVDDFVEELVSPVIDASAAAGSSIQLDFAHALVTTEATTLTLSLRVSANGGEDWTEAWSRDLVAEQVAVGPEIATVDLTPWLAGVAEARLAFRIAGDTTSSLAGWYLDNVLLVGLDVP